MELTDYISTDKITVTNQKTAQQTLAIFNDINYSHIPVINNKKLIGNVAKEDLICIDDASQKLSELEYLYEFFFAKNTDTLLEVFSNFAVNNTSLLPVVDDHNNYIGYLDINDLLDCFADTPFLSTEGNILLLQKNTKEYAMSEICQIVESNANVVLGCFLFDQNEETTKITLKVKSLNINELIQSFRRYDYYILNDLSEDSYLESLKKRSEYFIKYLNI
ncbi:CBS domain containing-hemolysin-like protein [Wenyingzhuangia heitensis]|uniref:CBS domain containing-hemolysin-like protein n=1 Tax=Wenyingzhuangia heitensis TaxID=1487859 RepID=A0ABX0U7Q2_9FLAO|nr:CBS domain-containing protein [Wenyingzhuangia heitensis]NIJ43780.1 CBS domain containing-hemolysin-like protein [Wenyingzhuangia heitensis]